MHAAQRGWGDALVLNHEQRIIESSRSNLFVVSNGVLYTPSLDDGCVGGIMRSVLIRTALDHGIKVYEAALTPQTLLQADELFLTNAVRGIEWVSSYKTKRYFHAMAEKLAAWIQEDMWHKANPLTRHRQSSLTRGSSQPYITSTKMLTATNTAATTSTPTHDDGQISLLQRTEHEQSHSVPPKHVFHKNGPRQHAGKPTAGRRQHRIHGVANHMATQELPSAKSLWHAPYARRIPPAHRPPHSGSTE